LRNRLISPLKEVIVPLVGRKLKTLFAPLEPWYRFHVWPARERLLTIGLEHKYVN
jgi:hypothetical protein